MSCIYIILIDMYNVSKLNLYLFLNKQIIIFELSCLITSHITNGVLNINLYI